MSWLQSTTRGTNYWALIYIEGLERSAEDFVGKHLFLGVGSHLVVGLGTLPAKICQWSNQDFSLVMRSVHVGECCDFWWSLKKACLSLFGWKVRFHAFT